MNTNFAPSKAFADKMDCDAIKDLAQLPDELMQYCTESINWHVTNECDKLLEKYEAKPSRKRRRETDESDMNVEPYKKWHCTNH